MSYSIKELQEFAIERGDALIKARNGLIKIAQQTSEDAIRKLALDTLDESTPSSVKDDVQR